MYRKLFRSTLLGYSIFYLEPIIIYTEKYVDLINHIRLCSNFTWGTFDVSITSSEDCLLHVLRDKIGTWKCFTCQIITQRCMHLSMQSPRGGVGGHWVPVYIRRLILMAYNPHPWRIWQRVWAQGGDIFFFLQGGTKPNHININQIMNQITSTSWNSIGEKGVFVVNTCFQQIIPLRHLLQRKEAVMGSTCRDVIIIRISA